MTQPTQGWEENKNMMYFNTSADRNAGHYTAEEYFGTHYDIWNEQYMLAKYGNQTHTEAEWETIMDEECEAHPEWAEDESMM